MAEVILPRTALGLDIQRWMALHYIGSPLFRVYQPITYMFGHASFGHLFFNMFALWMFGRILENVWGSKRFLIYYMVCGLGAAFTQEVLQWVGVIPQFQSVIGASGAVYGLLLAFAMLFPNMQMYIIPFPVPIKAKWMALGFLVIELVEGIFSVGNVAHFAHLGGMIFGFLLITYWRKRKRDGGSY
jgi:membrane associated rhomboid family serine protease